MTAIPESLLDDLRALVPDLLADASTDARSIEILGRAPGTVAANGQRVKGAITVLSTVVGMVTPVSSRSIFEADRPVGERRVKVTLPYDASLAGCVGLRIKGTDTIYEPLPGENNADTSFRVTTEIKAKETTLRALPTEEMS